MALNQELKAALGVKGGGYGLAGMSKAEKQGMLASIDNKTAIASSGNAKLGSAIETYNKGLSQPGTSATETPAATTSAATPAFTGGSITNKAGVTKFTVGADGKVYNAAGTLTKKTADISPTGTLTGINRRNGSDLLNVGTVVTPKGTGLLNAAGSATNKFWNPTQETTQGGSGDDTVDGGGTDDQLPEAKALELDENGMPVFGTGTQEEYQKAWQDYLTGQNSEWEKRYSDLEDQLNNKPKEYEPTLNSSVDADTETIEGRVRNLLSRDAAGNFSNPMIQQAAESAQAMFADRGLLNSSASTQAMMEAAIAKAIDIAGPDAQTYFQNRRDNVDWTNKFAQGTQQNANAKDLVTLEQKYKQQNLSDERSYALQQNYLGAVQNIDKMYQTQVMTIQSSQLTPQDKQAALNDLVINRDNSIRITSKAFEQIPQWEDQWSQLLTVQLPSYSSQKPADALFDLSGLAKADDYSLRNAIQWGAVNEDDVPDATFDAWVAEARKRNLDR